MYASSGTAEGSRGDIPHDLNPAVTVSGLAALLHASENNLKKLQFFGTCPVLLINVCIALFQPDFKGLKKDLKNNYR